MGRLVSGQRDHVEHQDDEEQHLEGEGQAGREAVGHGGGEGS